MNQLPVIQSSCCPPAVTSLDSEASERLADRFKALADPARIALVSTLAGNEEVCVCDLVAGSHLSQPTISHHLGILRRAGLVTSRRKGTWAYYRLVPEAVSELAATLTEVAESTPTAASALLAR